MRARIAQRQQIKGWGVSLILHGLLLSAILPIFRLLPAPIQPEPFRWNVTFVESSRQTTVVEPANDSSSAREFLQTVEAGEPGPVLSPSNLSTPGQQPKNEINETIQESNDVRPVMATRPTLFARAQPETSTPHPSTAEPAALNQESLPLQHNTTERQETIVATAPIPSEPSARLVEPIEQELRSTLAPLSVADAALEPTQPHNTSPVQLQSSLASSEASGQPSVPRADYSWLQQAVSRRLEELKRSSRPSLDDSSRLKVLVKAVVSNTGELMEAEVVTSSGLSRIDQEAMTLVQRAFPMPLGHVLDHQQIVMRIPITYSRD